MLDAQDQPTALDARAIAAVGPETEAMVYALLHVGEMVRRLTKALHGARNELAGIRTSIEDEYVAPYAGDE